MAFSHYIEAQERVAYVTFLGTVTGPELLRALVTLYDDPAWEPAYSALWDFRLVEELLLRASDFVALTAFDFTALRGQGRDALVTVRPLDYAMGEVLVKAARTSPRQMALFATESEARAWLNAATVARGLAA